MRRVHTRSALAPDPGRGPLDDRPSRARRSSRCGPRRRSATDRIRARPLGDGRSRARSNAIGSRSRADRYRGPRLLDLWARDGLSSSLGTAAGIGRGSGARAILVWTGLAGRARSEAVCRRWPRRARDRPGASRPRADRSRGRKRRHCRGATMRARLPRRLWPETYGRKPLPRLVACQTSPSGGPATCGRGL